MWQMYTIHTNLKMVYIHDAYKIVDRMERTFKYWRTAYWVYNVLLKVTIARISRALRRKTLSMVAIIYIVGK